MQKILIHTLFYKNYNYGGMLQAYALYSKLQQLGFECEELNYHYLIENKLKKLFLRSFRICEILKDPKYSYEFKQKIKRDKELHEKYVEHMEGDLLKIVFEKFMNTEFVSTRVFTPETIRGIEKKYDYYIAGGDQVWNPEWTDKNYFFAFANDGKKIGYSCSAGKSQFSSYDIRKIKKYIGNMDIVSVREQNFSDILTDNNIENQVIADPVFLLSKQEWSIFANDKYNLPAKYIFAYILGMDAERRKYIKKFAQLNELQIVSIPHVFRKYNKSDINFADIQISDAGPREFVSLIKNASFVVTDSFHGTAFSLIFEKQFLNFSRFAKDDKRSLNVRLQNVVEEYHLKERLIDVENIQQFCVKQMQEINYNLLANITQQKREDAIKFLKESLL